MTGFEIKALTPQRLTKSQLNEGKGQADTPRVQPEGYTGSAFRYVYLAVPGIRGTPGATREWIADFQRGLEDIHVELVDIKPYSIDVLVDAKENPRYDPELDRAMVRQLTLEYDGIQSLWRTGSLEAMAQRLEQESRKRTPRKLNQWQQSAKHRLRQKAYATRSG